MSLIKCRAIVIRTVNYSENSVILKCFTSTHGIQSYMVNGVRSKKGNVKPSQLLPLTLLELESYFQSNKNLQRIKELKCTPPLLSLHFDIIKSSIGIFMAEVMNKSFHEEDQIDEPMFEFLFHTIQILDIQQSSVSNFPLYFLVQLTRYLGFLPKGDYSKETNGFDIKEGCYEKYDQRNPFQMDPILTEKLSQFQHSDYEEYYQISFTNLQRTTLMNFLIEYFQQHIQGFGELKSHKILSEVLS
jgi:DNA repair protein RecO (recombination protein O)